MKRATSAVRRSDSFVASLESRAAHPAETVTHSIRAALGTDAVSGEQAADLIGGRDGLLQVRVVEHDDELLTAQAGHEITRTEPSGKRIGKGHQHLIADLVSVLLVEGAEAIEVENDGAQRPPTGQPLAPVRRQHPLQGLVKVATVVEAGQRVANGELRHLRVEEGIGDSQRGADGQELKTLDL